jgi:hypothetical protein
MSSAADRVMKRRMSRTGRVDEENFVQESADKDVAAPDDLSVVLGFTQMLSDGGNVDEVSPSQPIMAGSTRVVSSPLPETSLLARSCNKAERERYFVFGESLNSRFSCRSASAPHADGQSRILHQNCGPKISNGLARAEH